MKSHQEVENGREKNGGVAAEVSIGEEAAEEGHEGGDAGPVINAPRRRLQLLMKHSGEVNY